MSDQFLKNAEVVIVGAGLAGAHLAQFAARSGISTLLIDKDPFHDCGPQWINAVPLWMFDEAQLARPSNDLVFHQNEDFYLRSPLKTRRVKVRNTGIADVYMGKLGASLKQSFIKQASAQFVQGTVAKAQSDAQGRLSSIVVKTPDEKTLLIEAPLFVDAAGMRGVLRRESPLCQALCPPCSPKDVCVAAQETYEIKDKYGAEDFLLSNQVKPGDVLGDVGVSGGFSLFRVQVCEDMQQVSILTGARPLTGLASGQDLIQGFRKENPWVGKTIIKGQGAIPLSYPYAQLVAPGLALLGDSGCQVYASHGSGIGFGLIAARLLGETLVDSKNRALDLGALNSLWPYAWKFHNQYGGLLAFTDRFRRLAQDLDEKETHQLFESGLLSPSFVQKTLLQSDISVSIFEVLTLIKGAFLCRNLMKKFFPIATDSIRILGVGRRYPKWPMDLHQHASILHDLVGVH